MANFIKSSIEMFDFMAFNDQVNGPLPVLMFMAQAARTCYKSEAQSTQEKDEKLIKSLRDRGHHAMLEFGYAAAHLICNRGVTHELVRHRLASFAQESTRYCNYSKDKHGNEVTFIEPDEIDGPELDTWKEAMVNSEQSYLDLVGRGVEAQIARGVLPIDVKTEIWISCNYREWRHIFSLRCSEKAHPHIRKLMLQALKYLYKIVPPVFEDLYGKFFM